MTNNYSQQPLEPKKSTKKFWIFVSIVVFITAIPLIAFFIFSFIFSNEQQARQEAIDSEVGYTIRGGYAVSEDDVDPHLQRRITQRDNFVNRLDAQFGIVGFKNDTYVLRPYNYEGIGKPDKNTYVPVTVGGEVYLPATTDLAQLQMAIETTAGANGYTIASKSATDNGHISYKLERDDYPVGSEADYLEERVTLSITQPNEFREEISLMILDDTDTEYPLYGVPLLAGITENKEFTARWDWTDSASEAEYIEKFCALGSESPYGYWDDRFECLSDRKP